MRHRLVFAVLVIASALSLLVTSVTAPIASAAASGGNMTVLLVGISWTAGLNPETNPLNALDNTMNDAIFGGLFERTSKGIVPDLASGYTFSNGDRELTIHLRQGVKFQDGTPLDAAAVAEDIQTSLKPSSACICDSDFAPVTSVQPEGTSNVVLHMSKPYPTILSSFIDEAPDWPISTTALAKEGPTKFAEDPVGAGPFEVVSNVFSSKLVLKRYAGYWQKGQPYLSGLTFENIGSDTSALEGLQSGSAQMVENISTVQNIRNAMSSKQFHVTQIPGIGTEWVQMNRTQAPFNQLKAREAIYYATDASTILKKVQLGLGVVSESGSGPGSSNFQATVPGYRAYDLAKAKQLVTQLGGLSFSLVATTTTSTAVALAEALASEWAQAGIKVNLDEVTINEYLRLQETHAYQVQVTVGGGYDPAVGIDGLNDRVSGIIGGEEDATLNNLIAKTLEVTPGPTQNKLFSRVYERISSQAYGPYLYAPPAFVVTTPGVGGVHALASGTLPEVQWEDATVK